MVSVGEQQRREVFFSGHVQGVGFRYTVRGLAAGFAVAGFVRNLTDGRVQAVVEGERGEIDRFLRAIHQEMDHYIAGVQETIGAASGQFEGFGIKF